MDAKIASALAKEHHSDKFYYKGITLTPGGFLELAGVYRQHFEGTDVGSNLLIPFPNVRQSHVSEGRFSARQSRISLLAEGSVNANTRLSAYGEIDFLGAAQTANSVESNSYNPRVRNLYVTIDWDRGDHGWHFLAGQSWSLATMNAKGITPRNESLPPQIDAQFIPGFVWTRQPGVRLAADFLDHTLWAAISVENPQTSFGRKTPPTVVATASGGAWFNAANRLSLNHVPDVIGKLAYEADLAGHGVHVETFGMMRSFDAHLLTGSNASAHGYGIGGGVEAQLLPGLLDARLTGLHGTGVGRYGTSGLPDVTFSPDGKIHPITETAVLAGLTLHATKGLDLYGFAGEERQDRQPYEQIGLGNIGADNNGCFTAGGICAGDTHQVRQITGGFWDKIYQGSFGQAEVGMQYSYTQRQLFAGAGGAPWASQNMGFVSFRYYPF
ncbi:hypothetical protein [Sphingomonas nostoxanthinifaciens]|uniref:hypothetical protein n=1 Tax=Sphingomonas nostoxanthinifaciens TaxID=2872652 RepID=UPI001CC212FA|nr:hypothetical protein [Sphingomonas nostoxanthinifaciens]UAK25897.1 hypothetical protein K8P63_07185 [Sphingomonas nostoxanthinifaciens]